MTKSKTEKPSKKKAPAISKMSPAPTEEAILADVDSEDHKQMKAFLEDMLARVNIGEIFCLSGAVTVIDDQRDVHTLDFRCGEWFPSVDAQMAALSTAHEDMRKVRKESKRGVVLSPIFPIGMTRQ